MVGGLLTVAIVIGIKLIALFGLSHLVHGATTPVILIVLLLVGILARYLTRFLRL